MASHFGNINAVCVETWAQFKTIADETGASKIFYCDHTDHYTTFLVLNGLYFMHIIVRTSPVEDPSDEKDFDDNRKSGALRVG